MWLESGGYVMHCDGGYAAVADRLFVVRGPDVLMQTRLLALGARVNRGHLVEGTTRSWLALRSEVLKDPSLMSHFPHWHRKFEEFVAGGYFASRWAEVTLSPQSNDGGFDIAARKRGRQILDEAKAFKPSRRVGHVIVRAALGLLTLKLHSDVDQVRVTTTSSFAPTIESKFRERIPRSLQLRDRRRLLGWLSSMHALTES